MSFKKGDRVLVDATYVADCLSGGGYAFVRAGCAPKDSSHPEVPTNRFHMFAGRGCIESYPGVPVADLVRECELASTWRQCWSDFQRSSEFSEYILLVHARQDAREATAKPKFVESNGMTNPPASLIDTAYLAAGILLINAAIWSWFGWEFASVVAGVVLIATAVTSAGSP